MRRRRPNTPSGTRARVWYVYVTSIPTLLSSGANPAASVVMPGKTVKPDTTVKKVSSAYSPQGRMGQKYLVSGKRLAMRLWEEEPGSTADALHVREYETVGFVISGRAQLNIEGQTLVLEAGDSWLVPAGARHGYRILESFTAVEATAPPSQVKSRDEP